MTNKGITDLRIEVYRHLSQLPDIALAGLAQAEQSDVEQGRDWLHNLIATVFQDDPGIAFYALFSEDALLALLPLRHADKGDVHALGNFYCSLYQPYFAPGLNAEALARLLLFIKQTNSITALKLAPLDVGGLAYPLLLNALRQAGFICFPYFCFGNWHLPVTESWKTYLEKRPGQIKSSLKRKAKEFQQAGGRLEIISGTENLDVAIAAYESVYAASWKEAEPFPEFVPALIRMLAKNNWLRLGLATLNGQTIAAQIWIIAHGRACIFKLAYHKEFKRYSAGTLLTANLMEQAMTGDKVREIDYLVGDDPYKASWMSHRRERWGIIAYNPYSWRGIYGAILESAARFLQPLIDRLRRKKKSKAR